MLAGPHHPPQATISSLIPTCCRLLGILGRVYQMKFPTGLVITKKGQPTPIQVKLETRTGNKKVRIHCKMDFFVHVLQSSIVAIVLQLLSDIIASKINAFDIIIILYYLMLFVNYFNCRHSPFTKDSVLQYMHVYKLMFVLPLSLTDCLVCLCSGHTDS